MKNKKIHPDPLVQYLAKEAARDKREAKKQKKQIKLTPFKK